MQTTAATEKIYSFANFEMDAARRLLLKNKVIVALNPNAFDLLLTLVENSGAVLSKNELLDKVWANQFVEENNLTVHIAALRKALGEKKNEHRSIVTVPDKGCYFVAKVQTVSLEEIEDGRNGEKPALKISESNDNADSNQTVSTNRLANFLSVAPESFDERQTLIGRNREIAGIKNLLRGDAANLITLTGAGGSGKTRLARAVAEDLAADFPDGIFFVELAAVTEAELVAPTIAGAVGAADDFRASGKFFKVAHRQRERFAVAPAHDARGNSVELRFT